MQVSQQALAYMLLCALLCGIALGVLYDFVSLVRRRDAGRYPHAEHLRERLKPPKALSPRRKQAGTMKKKEWIFDLILFFEDVAFCLLFSVVTVLLLYATNDGQWRTSVPVLMLVAFFGYRATLGRPIRQALAYLRALLSTILAWILALLFFPIRLAWYLTEKPRRAFVSAGCRLWAHIIACISVQKRKLRRKNNPPTPPLRRPPDGKTVFAKGGYHPMN